MPPLAEKLLRAGVCGLGLVARELGRLPGLVDSLLLLSACALTVVSLVGV